jgi:hypothetical protein
MSYVKKTRAIALVILLSVVGLAPASTPAARANPYDITPELPSPLCDSLNVPEGNSVFDRVYAKGVQVYRWNGTSWAFVEPVALLFADANYHGKVGTHYLGPTWESNSGSKVVAARVPGTGCTPDPTAIAWLKLQTVSNEGPGLFESVTFVLRVNTSGGLAPTVPGSSIGAVAEVPYTAEYYFYRASE